MRSGHGVGKTTVLAWCIVCHLLTRFPQKTVCTAPTSGQLFDALAAETKAWLKKLPLELQKLFEIKTEEITHVNSPDESFVAFKTSRPEVPEALAGIHSQNVLLIGDEASGIPEPVFEAAAGSMSGFNATTLLAGNPVRSGGLFFDTHNKADVMSQWRRIHISCVGHPRVTPDFIEDMKARYGEDSNAFRVRVLGEFPLADDDTIIALELATAALQRDVKAFKVPPIWGLDVARFGADATCLAKRRGNVLEEKTKIWKGLDTMQVVGRVNAEWELTARDDRPSAICVDAIGLGAGVADRLRELGLPALAINVSESPALGDKYRNQRAELWFLGKEWFAARDCNIHNDVDLSAELTVVKYKFTSNGKIQVESKDEMKKRGLPSPNRADAFLLTFAVPATTALHGTNYGVSSWKKPISRVLKGIV